MFVLGFVFFDTVKFLPRRSGVCSGRRGAGEVGVDFEAVEIADDEQRRIGERFAVLQKLLIGFAEVFVLALVFPAEEAAPPDVREALPARFLVHALLKGVPLAFRVRIRWSRLAEQRTDVQKVFLTGGVLLEFGGLPFVDELLGRHGVQCTGSGNLRQDSIPVQLDTISICQE